MQVPKLDFIELKYYENVWPDDELEVFDSVLGLAIEHVTEEREGGETPPRLPGTFRQMINEGLLDENVVSIRWPRTKDEIGDITFGGYDEKLFKGELVKHPLWPKNTTEWRVGIDALYLLKQDGSEATKITGSGPSTRSSSNKPDWNALLMNTTPMIGFPQIMAEIFFRSIPAKRSECPGAPPVVDCNIVPSLPELIIEMNGQNITLNGEDYVKEYTPPEWLCHDAKSECMVTVADLPPWDDTFPPDMIVLGTAFLANVYGVFNWDERSVFCELPSFGVPV